MATYVEIQAYVKTKHGYTPKTCWIAHMKELTHQSLRRAPNRQGPERVEPCPEGKRADILEAFRHFRMVPATAGAMEQNGTVEAIRRAEAETPSLQPLRLEDALAALVGGDPSHTSVREPVSSYYGTNIPHDENWFVAFTTEFIESADRLDKKVKGRAFEAVTEICRSPMTLRGDTVKPLQGQLKGKWRFRMGDYRIVYQPVEKSRSVFLLTIAPRGDVYVD